MAEESKRRRGGRSIFSGDERERRRAKPFKEVDINLHSPICGRHAPSLSPPSSFPGMHTYLECPHVLQQWVGLRLVHQIDCPNVGALNKGNEGLELRGRFEEEFKAHLWLLAVVV